MAVALGDLCSGNQRGGGLFDTYGFVAALNDADEVNMDVQKGSDDKDTSRPLPSENPPISIAAPKLLSYNMESRSVFPTKTPSFLYSNVYLPMSLNILVLFGGGIKSNAVTSSLSGEFYLLRVGSL